MTVERWSAASRAYAANQPTVSPKATLRVGDAERRRVVEHLQRHFVDGRLTSDELSERMGQALAARTVADLQKPLADLPSLDAPTPASAAERWWTRFTTFPGVILLAIVGLMALTWLLWLPSAHLGADGAPVWSFLFLGGFFFIGKRR